jgi:hypothetical protein
LAILQKVRRLLAVFYRFGGCWLVLQKVRRLLAVLYRFRGCGCLSESSEAVGCPSQL